MEEVNACRFGNDHSLIKEHSCPFREEIDNNYEFRCQCCDRCRKECMDDI